MKSLVTKYPWLLPLLLLLLQQPLKLQGNYWDYFEYEVNPEFHEYMRELHSTGPTVPPTKERIMEKILADAERPLYGEDYCNSELVSKRIHYRLRCYPEHFLAAVTYTELQKACFGEHVTCKDGVGFCRRSMEVIDGVQCILESGEKMPDCTYKSIFTQGYAVVTCQWDEDSEEFIPNHVHDILPTPSTF